MVLFVILLCALLAIAAVTLVAAIIGGGSVLVLFGDMIVFGLIIMGLIKLIRKKK